MTSLRGRDSARATPKGRGAEQGGGLPRTAPKPPARTAQSREGAPPPPSQTFFAVPWGLAHEPFGAGSVRVAGLAAAGIDAELALVAVCGASALDLGVHAGAVHAGLVGVAVLAADAVGGGGGVVGQLAGAGAGVGVGGGDALVGCAEFLADGDAVKGGGAVVLGVAGAAADAARVAL